MPADASAARSRRRRRPLAPGLLALAALLPGVADAATLAQMRGARRVLVISAPSEHDARLERQRRALGGWRGAAERDVSTIELVAGLVRGADDAPAALRRRLGLSPSGFAVVLVGKDGHVALRSATPLTAGRLEAVIDGMPMRRAGQR